MSTNDFYGNDLVLESSNTDSTPTASCRNYDKELSYEDLYEAYIQHISQIKDLELENKRLHQLLLSNSTAKGKQDTLRIQILEDLIYSLDQKNERKKGNRMLRWWLCIVAVFEFFCIRYLLSIGSSFENLMYGFLSAALTASFYFVINLFIYLPLFAKASEENLQLALYKQELHFLRNQ